MVKSADDWLKRMIIYCNWGRKGRNEKLLITGTVKGTIYLSAYMIATMPERVFDQIGVLEKALIETAGPLIRAVETVC